MSKLEYDQMRFAVLIDADNAQYTVIADVLEEVANYGAASVKRVYGDWSSQNLKAWKDIALEHSIQPIQQYAYTKRKNATDFALVIDAMDLLYSGNLDGFCIVSSDSDFTRLSQRLRESGKTVFGFGEEKTPEPFKQSCDRFFSLENLNSTQSNKTETSQLKKSPSDLKQDTRLINSIRSAIEKGEDDEGWAELGSVGQTIQNIFPQFDVRTYGYSKLKSLINVINLFEVKTQKNKNGNVKTYVMDKKRR